ncbi:MAG: zinc ribbon domain-containing protein [Acidobacteriota bacterium]
MPIYEYSCEKCGSRIEVIQKISDAPLKRCEKCRGKLAKVVSRTSFQLKGSGWYASDYSTKTAPAGVDKTDKGTDKADKGTDKTDKGTDKTDKGADKTDKGTDKTDKGADKKSESVSKTTAPGDKD